MKIQFSTEGAAFIEYGYLGRAEEIKRILDTISEKVELGHEDGVIMDVNGNKIGGWSL